MNRLTRGMAALVARQRAGAAPTGPLVYHRADGGATVTLTGKAWVGRTAFRVSDRDAGSRVVWSDRDYLVPAADLAVSGSPVTPARGDWFEETLPDGVVKFEVVPFNGEPEWRFSDPQRTLYRIHCKRVA